jgi:hypothetical protein
MIKFKRFGILSKSLALACMVWSLSGFARSEEAQTESVTAEGVGKTEASAKKAAFKEAIQKVVGVLVDSSTQVKNEEIIKDEVLEYSGGFVSKSETLSSKKDDEGLFRVKVKCVVEKAQVKKKLESLSVITVKVDGATFAEKESSKDAMRLDASKMLGNVFEERKKLYRLKVPEKIGDLKRDEDGTAFVPVEVYFNQNDYKNWLTNSKKVFEKVMTDSASGYSLFKVYTNPTIAGIGKMPSFSGKKLVDINNNLRIKATSEEPNRKEQFFVNVAESFSNNGAAKWTAYKIQGDMTSLPGMTFREENGRLSLVGITSAKLIIELHDKDGSIVAAAETKKFGHIESSKSAVKNSNCIFDPTDDREARGIYVGGGGSALNLLSLPNGKESDGIELGPLPCCAYAYPTYGVPGAFGSVFKFNIGKEELGKVSKITARLEWK